MKVYCKQGVLTIRNLENSKLFTEFYDEYGDNDTLFLPYKEQLIKMFDSYNFDFEGHDCEIVYNFLKFILVKDDIMINYITTHIQELKHIDKCYLKLLEKKHGEIHHCAKKNDIVGVITSIKLGNINIRDNNGWTALMEILSIVPWFYDYDNTIKLLVEHGADVNIQGNSGRTALHHASFRGRDKNVKLLLEHGADVNIQDSSGRTALMDSFENGWGKAKLMLEYSVNVNIQDKYGQTALMSACYRGHTETVKLLLEYGADVNMKDESGWTALTYALIKEDRNKIKLLKEYNGV